MRFTEKTLSVLKNFSTINNGIIIKKGNIQRTVSLTRDILAESSLDQEFPMEFGIYDLNGFLSLLSMFDDDYDIDFDKDYMLIKSGNRKLKYFYASHDVIFSPPDGLSIESPTQRFDLPLSDLKMIQKVSSYGMGNLTINSDGDNIDIAVSNTENSSSNELQIEVKQQIDPCNVTFDVNLMKVIPDDYSVGVNDESVHLKNEDNTINYWIVVSD